MKGLLWLTVRVPPGGEGRVAGVCCHTFAGIQTRTPDHGVLLLTFGMVLPPPIYKTQERLHRQAQRFVS